MTGLVDELKQKYRDIPVVVEHLERMQADIVDNVSLFLRPSDGPGLPAQMQEILRSRESDAMRRYAINVLVDQQRLRGCSSGVRRQAQLC